MDADAIMALSEQLIASVLQQVMPAGVWSAALACQAAISTKGPGRALPHMQQSCGTKTECLQLGQCLKAASSSAGCAASSCEGPLSCMPT